MNDDDKKDDSARRRPSAAPPSRAGTVRPPSSLRSPAGVRDSSPRVSAIDFELVNAARRVLDNALSLVLGERLVVLSDRENLALAQPVADIAQSMGATVEIVVLEDVTSRPMRALPTSVAEALASAQASMLFASADDAEASAMSELFAVVRSLRLRHAHLVGVSRRGLLRGFSVDPARVLDVTRAIRTRLRPDSTIALRTPRGSDLQITLTPAHRWIEHVGPIRPGRWQQLPSHAIRTAPATVRGVFVADASVSGCGGARGELSRAPIHFEIDGGTCKSVRSTDLLLQRRVEEAMRRDLHGDRVGGILLGTNVGLAEPLGETSCDQGLPGLHLTFGDTFADQTGASWSSSVQVTVTCCNADVDLDGNALLRAGRYMVT